MSLRKILFWIHLATGCLAGAVILIMSVTGVLLAFERRIVGWMDRDFRSSAGAHAARLPVESILAGFATQNHTPPSSLTLRSDPAAPAEVTFGRDHVFLVNVYTGQVLGESAPRTRSFFRQAENWHRWLGAANDNRAAARAVTGACNLGFLILVISGPFLWLPRKWSWRNLKAVALFRGGLSGRARDFNWHNVIGIWCAAPLFLIVLSGVVMSYPWATNLIYRLTGSDPPVQGAGQGSEGGRRPTAPEAPGPGFAGLNASWSLAEQQVPGWRSVTLGLTPPGRGPLTYTIDTGNGGRPDQRSQLTLNRRTAEVIRWEPFSNYNTGRRLRGWFRFLHTGEAGGLAGQSIAGLASTGAAVLVWTGIWLAFRRLWRWGRRGSALTPSARQDTTMTIDG